MRHIPYNTRPHPSKRINPREFGFDVICHVRCTKPLLPSCYRPCGSSSFLVARRALKSSSIAGELALGDADSHLILRLLCRFAFAISSLASSPGDQPHSNAVCRMLYAAMSLLIRTRLYAVAVSSTYCLNLHLPSSDMLWSSQCSDGLRPTEEFFDDLAPALTLLITATVSPCTCAPTPIATLVVCTERTIRSAPSRSARPFASATSTASTSPLRFSVNACIVCERNAPTMLPFLESRASGSVALRCVVFPRLSPRKSTPSSRLLRCGPSLGVGLSPSSSPPSSPSRAMRFKLFNEAWLWINDQSTAKCSSLASPA